MRRCICVVALTAFASLPAAGNGQDWTQIGPQPIQGQGFSNLPNATVSGIVTGIAIDPSGSSDSTIYIATGGGGVWKTTNGGAVWNVTTDSMPTLTMGAVALDPSNPSIVYAGVGGRWCCFEGGGLYTSQNGGGQWAAQNPFGIFSGNPINAIVLPASGTVLAATLNGLYKSVDGGQNFGNNSPQFNNGSPISIATPQGNATNVNISDLRLDTATPTTVYVAIDNQGIYKSVDSGTTFPASGMLLGPSTFPTAVSSTGDVFIKFAQSTKPNNGTFYAFLCSGKKPEPCALLKSINGGAFFSSITLSGITINQGDYDQIVGVDPQDGQFVYIGLRQLYFAADGGASGISTQNQIDKNGAHTDDHVIVFSPASHITGPPPTQVYLGTDGGFAATAAQSGAPGSQWQFLNGGISTALLYAMDIGRGNGANNVYSFGASQDNGTFVKTPSVPSLEWQFQCCGDSGSVAVDPQNPLHALTLNDGGLTCTTNAQDWSNCGNLPPSKIGASLVSFDPTGGTAYVARGAQLFQSKDNGSTYSSVQTFPQNIRVIAQVKGNPNLLWIGQNDGTMQQTTSALLGSSATWTKVTVSGAPSNQAVTGIAIDPTNQLTVVAVYPGFSGSADPPQHAFLTVNGGASWQNISGVSGGGDNNLPDLPLHAVVIVPNNNPHIIVVATDSGVLQTADTGKTWQVLGIGIPSVEVTGMSLDSSVSPFVLRASTWGRSVYQLEGSCPLCPPAPQCGIMTGCVSTTNWSYSMTCTGVDVGIAYNAGCTDLSGERRNCYAGFNGQSTVQVSWSGSSGPPNWWTAAQQGSPTVCTTNNTGQSNCKVFTFAGLPPCPTPPPGPPPLCQDGQKYCTQFTPPRCVPEKQCLVIPIHP
jgi:hypothetical protein